VGAPSQLRDHVVVRFWLPVKAEEAAKKKAEKDAAKKAAEASKEVRHYPLEPEFNQGWEMGRGAVFGT